jgi:hypothetical protein
MATLLPNTTHLLSFGAGIFGWTAIQVHANRVDKQLHIMLHIDLVPNLSTLRDKSEGGRPIGMSEGVGRAMEEANERYSKVKKIIILPALVELKGFQTSRRGCYFICENLESDLWEFILLYYYD